MYGYIAVRFLNAIRNRRRRRRRRTVVDARRAYKTLLLVWRENIVLFIINRDCLIAGLNIIFMPIIIRLAVRRMSFGGSAGFLYLYSSD